MIVFVNVHGGIHLGTFYPFLSYGSTWVNMGQHKNTQDFESLAQDFEYVFNKNLRFTAVYIHIFSFYSLGFFLWHMSLLSVPPNGSTFDSSPPSRGSRATTFPVPDLASKAQHKSIISLYDVICMIQYDLIFRKYFSNHISI